MYNCYAQCCGSETIISDPDPNPDPTWRVISDPDPDPALRSFRIRILVCEFFALLKSDCKFNGHFCAEIELFRLNLVFLSLHFSSRGLHDYFGSRSYSSAYFGSGSWKVKVSDPYRSESGSATQI